MAGDSPAAILFDAYGNAIATLDGYNITATSPGLPIMIKDSAGNAFFLQADSDGYLRMSAPSLEAKDFATETTQQTLATETTLSDAYDKLDDLESKDFATETTQQTLATEATLVDAYNKLDSLEAKDFATETTLASLETKDFATEATLLDAYNKLDSLEAKDFATETTLTSIKDTDGIKKIADALPAGDNIVGQVKITDGTNVVDVFDDYGVHRLQVESIIPDGYAGTQAVYLIDGVNGVELAVAENEPVPANTRSLLTTAIDGDGYAQRINAVADGSSYRLMVDTKAVLVSTASIIDFVKNGGSEDMLVNGSVTPVTFSFDADPTNDIVLTNFVLCMSALSVDLDGSSWGAGTDLANGILVQATVNNGVSINIGLFQRNEDFRRLLDTDIAQGGITDNIVGVISFGGRMILKAGTADKVEVIIQDNLTLPARNLDYLTATVYGLKE